MHKTDLFMIQHLSIHNGSTVLVNSHRVVKPILLMITSNSFIWNSVKWHILVAKFNVMFKSLYYLINYFYRWHFVAQTKITFNQKVEYWTTLFWVFLRSKTEHYFNIPILLQVLKSQPHCASVETVYFYNKIQTLQVYKCWKTNIHILPSQTSYWGFVLLRMGAKATINGWPIRT